ncbi:MAG: hypothetical protein Q8L00_13070 [Deltaproteobacteria bacterium]|nr:hypothetical protein [Deltaproteobacteria bacterium]
MQVLFRVLMLVFFITGLALSATSVNAQQSGVQQLISQLLSGLNPQWTQIPGVPGVQYAPNANADLFRYDQRYYYQHDGNWYRGRDMGGPWERVQDVPQRFRQIEAPYFRQPPEWAGYRPQLPSGLTPQWTAIPGAPGVHYTPNANTDLFRYGQSYYYQHDGKWYQTRNMAGPWQRVNDVPRSFRQIEAPYFKQPPGWAKGKKTGWGDASMPPGQVKKYEPGQHMSPGQMKKYEGDQHGQKNKHDGGQHGQKNKHDR